MKQSGFTLIEIMIVIVVIGILATFATLSIGDRALDDRLEAESKRMQQILRLAEEEADLKGVAIGLRFSSEGYRFLVIDNARNWVDYEQTGLLRGRSLLQPFYPELRIENQLIALKRDDDPEGKATKASSSTSAKLASSPPPTGKSSSTGSSSGSSASASSGSLLSAGTDDPDAKKIQPQVLLLPGGQLTPFSLDIRAPNYASYFHIEGDAVGRITRERRNENDLRQPGRTGA